jgi:exosortase E/protease (VPEID-CTERM system)
MPVLVLNATALVTAMLARDIDPLYGLRLIAAGAALVAFRRYYRDLPRTGSVLSVAVGLAIGAAWVLTSPRGGELAAVEVDWFWLATRTVGSVLVVPLVEELAFRGCLLRWFVSRDFTTVSFTRWTPWAVAGSSLVFGLLHERWIEATLVGAVYAALQLRRGRIGEAILAHAATNAVVTGAVLWTGNLALWS